MAAPARTPQEIAQLIHVNPAGTTIQGFTLTSKDVINSGGNQLIIQAVITRNTDVWTAKYATQQDGTLGKIYYVVDQDGRRWRSKGGWVDEGWV